MGTEQTSSPKLPPGGHPIAVNKHRIIGGRWSYPRDKDVHDLYYITHVEERIIVSHTQM